jgi:tetratricopeptide (TPR) repeat protein
VGYRGPCNSNLYSNRTSFPPLKINKVNRATRLCRAILFALLFCQLISLAAAQVDHAVPNSGNYTISVQQLQISPRVRGRISKAEKDFQRADLAGAQTELHNALVENPKCAPALTMRALIKLAAKQPEEAIEDSMQATLIDAHDSHAFLALATALNAHRDYVEAEKAARQALNLKPDLWQAHLEIAKSLYSTGKLVPALHELEGLQIDFADVHLVRGDVLMLLERHQEAVYEFTKFLGEAPHDPRSGQVQQIVNDAVLLSLKPL